MSDPIEKNGPPERVSLSKQNPPEDLSPNDISSDEKKSEGYGTVFKASSMLGGSQGISYFLGLIRTKSLAYLLGPTGVGLMSQYSTIVGTVGTFAGLGTGESAVREVASAHANHSPETLSKTVQSVRLASLLTGILGTLITVFCAYPLSQFNFHNSEHVLPIALLGIMIPLNTLAAGEAAILQGSGNLAKYAKMNVLSSILGAFLVVVIYSVLGEKGIIPGLIASSVLSLAITWYFSRTIPLVKTQSSWKEIFEGIKPLLLLGLAFMLTGICWQLKDMVLKSQITLAFGVAAIGIFQSAWNVSGLFVNFVLRAMGLDLYPRLTAMVDDHEGMIGAVNQQIEVGVLLALPGVVGTITCAPFVIFILYSSKFMAASDLLAVMSCGVFFKVISYPLNIIQLAKGDAKGFASLGAAFAILELLLSLLFLKFFGLVGAASAYPPDGAHGPGNQFFGLVGAASAYPVSCFCHVVVMWWTGRKLIGFRMDAECVKLITTAFAFVVISLFAVFILKGYPSYFIFSVGILLSIASALYCIRSLVQRLGKDHRIVKMFLEIPGGKWLV